MNGITASVNSMMQGAQNTMLGVAQALAPSSSNPVDLTKIAGAMMESKIGVEAAVALMKTANEMSAATLNILA